jgi:hypothetical protein
MLTEFLFFIHSVRNPGWGKEITGKTPGYMSYNHFAGAKQALLPATHLAHPTELSVVVDASATHVSSSSCPERRTGSPWDSAFDRELFVCYSGIRHIRYVG